MEFSWNKWRQYIIQEAAVSEADEFDTIGEITPFFGDAASMGIIRKVDAQRVMDAAGNSEDQDAFESTQEFQQIGKEIIMRATEVLEQDGRETHYLYTKFIQQKNNPVEGADIANAVNILSKSGGMSAVGMALPEGEENLEEDKFDNPGWDLKAIMDSFKEDFEEATRDTDDIVYAQERVIAAYKDVFAKSHPKLSREIDMYLNNEDAEARKMFQNVADDPEVAGRDMMREFRDDDGEDDFGGDPQDFGNDPESRFQFIAPRLVRFPGKKEQLKPFFLQMTDAMDEDDKVAFDTAFVKAMQIMGYGEMLSEMLEEGAIVATFNVGDRAKLIIDPKLGVNQPGKELEVVDVREVPKGGGGTYQDVTVQRYENGKPVRKSYDNSQLALVGLGPISRREEDELGGYPLGELEGEVQSEGIPDVNTDFSVDTDFSAFDEAQNEMALEKALEIASKLDTMQNDLEATLSDSEIDALSDAIMLLRKK